MKRRLTCIECPIGCSLETQNITQELTVSGNQCARGERYALKEVRNPFRSLTTTVATVFANCPRLPVRTKGEIPRKDLFVAMELINSIIIEHPLLPGDLVLKDLLGTGVDLIATGPTDPVYAFNGYERSHGR